MPDNEEFISSPDLGKGLAPESKETKEAPPAPASAEDIEDQNLPQQESALTPESQAPQPEAASPVEEEPSERKFQNALEEVLAKDLKEIYLELTPEIQPTFKEKGEAVAVSVMEMHATGKIKKPEILELIRDWLKLIPNVSTHYLEQEAKRKTDGVMLVVKDFAPSEEEDPNAI